MSDEVSVDAVIRNLEVIGEAVKHIPAAFKRRHGNVQWKKIAGLRDILIHEYFAVDLDILWDVISNKIPGLRMEIQSILEQEDVKTP